MAPPRLHFLGFVLDFTEYRLDRGGVPIEVEPKVLDVLMYLIQHRDRVVPRRELISAVWAGVRVGDASLSRAIREARRVLGDTGDEQHAIRTVQRRGFQFVAEVREGPAHATREVPMMAAPEPGLEECPLVERTSALTALTHAFERLAIGRGALCLLCGEPGMGKSRTLIQLGASLAARGVTTVAAAVPDDDRAPPLWPWLQVSRRLLREHPSLLAQPELAPLTAELALIAPELRASCSSTPPDPANSYDRFFLADAVARLLELAAGIRSVAVLLDDFQWADRASLVLLERLVPSVATAPLAIVAAYRDAQAGSDTMLARTIGNLLRRSGVLVELRGLTRDELAELMRARTGVPPTPAAVDSMADLTGGNPLFVDQVFHLLGDRSAAAMQDAKLLESLQLRHGVTEAIVQQVDVLSGDARCLLRAGAVLGRDFELPIAAAMTGATSKAAAAAIHQAERGGVVRWHPAAHAYAFVHSLLREALYQQLSPAERSRLHSAAAEALRTLHRDQDVDDVHTLAAHYVRALPAAAAEVVHYVPIAAEHASARGAYDKAAELYEHALAADRMLAPDDARRMRLLLRLGSALGRDGRLVESAEAFARATALARRTADPGPTLDAPALCDSFRLAVERMPALGDRFYEKLFTRHPAVALLFRRNTPRAQSAMFLSTLMSIVDHLEDAPWLAQHLAALGARHADYDITDSMYAWVGSCLIDTLAEGVGPAWNVRTQHAWETAFAAISEHMRAGARLAELARAESLPRSRVLSSA
jgi:DNA-binding winged helix-turn-helix (wHTH) protein/hemoglobin-like flavoprotein